MARLLHCLTSVSFIIGFLLQFQIIALYVLGVTQAFVGWTGGERCSRPSSLSLTTSSLVGRGPLLTCSAQQQDAAADVEKDVSSVALPDYLPYAYINGKTNLDFDHPRLRYLRRDPDVIVVDDFLTAEECDAIAKGAFDNYGFSEAMGLSSSAPKKDITEVLAYLPENQQNSIMAMANMQKGTGEAKLQFILKMCRVYESRNKYKHVILTGAHQWEKLVFERLQSFFGCGMSNFAGPDILFYEGGGRQLSRHSDGVDHFGSFLCYLNDVVDGNGGTTHFIDLGLKVQPKKGQAVIFFTAIVKDGERVVEDDRLDHESEAVFQDKLVLRCFLREPVEADPELESELVT